MIAAALNSVVTADGEGLTDRSGLAEFRGMIPYLRQGHRRLVHMSLDSTLLSRITIDPGICHGKPCVRGLRYTVEVLLELLSSGMTFDDVLKDYGSA